MKRKKSSYDSLVLFMIGAICIVLSFFSNYNFSDFSRMQFFVSFISSLLILAVTLQRVTGIINFYLKASPVMLMMLSFFFFDSIVMLFYSLFVFFVFVLLSIWARMNAPLIELLKFNIALFLLSLPIVIVLFVSFPRIAFKKADFGFRSDQYGNSVYSGSMNVSNTAFTSSGKVIMEVFFDGEIPSEDQLYFRGSTLYPAEKFQWREKTDLLKKEYLNNKTDIISYDMLFYPHAKKWLYPLAIPVVHPEKTTLKNDYTLQSEKPIYEQKRYRFQSALNYSLLTDNSDAYLDYNSSLYPKTAQALESLKSGEIAPEEKARSLMSFFRSLQISYTTDPQNLDASNIIDSFLFDVKRGYCTHFASAFAIAARIVGVPSRVVSGYKANYKNRVENYIVVKQEDAHAWVELYLPKKGWTRFEPTATNYQNLDLNKKKRGFEQYEIFHEINKQYMYFKYLISNWILGFDRLKQIGILDSLLNDTIYLLKFIFSFLAIVLFSFLSFLLVRSWNSLSKFDKIIQSLLKKLEGKKIIKQKGETMQQFFEKSQEQLGISFDKVNQLYHIVKYSKDKNHLEVLEKEISSLKHKL